MKHWQQLIREQRIRFRGYGKQILSKKRMVNSASIQTNRGIVANLCAVRDRDTSAMQTEESGVAQFATRSASMTRTEWLSKARV